MGASGGSPSWADAGGSPTTMSPSSPNRFCGGIDLHSGLPSELVDDAAVRRSADQTLPATLIAGDRDGVIRGASAEQLTASMSRVNTDFRGVTLIPSAGHWVQQERPEETMSRCSRFWPDSRTENVATQTHSDVRSDSGQQISRITVAGTGRAVDRLLRVRVLRSRLVVGCCGIGDRRRAGSAGRRGAPGIRPHSRPRLGGARASRDLGRHRGDPLRYPDAASAEL